MKQNLVRQALNSGIQEENFYLYLFLICFQQPLNKNNLVDFNLEDNVILKKGVLLGYRFTGN